jgi:myosin protein heavy chain
MVSLFRNSFVEDKRRLELHINQLEEELEEEQTNTEILGDKVKKLAMIHEQDMLDTNAEKAKNEKLEVKFKQKKIFK